MSDTLLLAMGLLTMICLQCQPVESTTRASFQLQPLHNGCRNLWTHHEWHALTACLTLRTRRCPVILCYYHVIMNKIYDPSHSNMASCPQRRINGVSTRWFYKNGPPILTTTSGPVNTCRWTKSSIDRCVCLFS